MNTNRPATLARFLSHFADVEIALAVEINKFNTRNKVAPVATQFTKFKGQNLDPMAALMAAYKFDKGAVGSALAEHMADVARNDPSEDYVDLLAELLRGITADMPCGMLVPLIGVMNSILSERVAAGEAA
ncbi:hypothetical protein CCC_04074 [Paramagnetospirillum magnetotacticum MS-1]|uniref:Uncharacterized protein n=1 Tax=Paramagnetospirillum magnetotacticum MS-1 TaxID=272627 RepID=A0A0C2YWQ4_PARME|nr:hypothetical protein [Paramagnetospirillum magnetotacticum]KIL99558.1 hypothetical protein CCC_04074 [Paramagnetospirillum magnetotacticum MS-1]